ncbi:MAG: hypothetical protein ACJAS1_001858 [Oleiphilaceae bacterium]|jgi:hypothetical protein
MTTVATSQVTPYTRLVKALAREYHQGNYYVDSYSIESLLDMSLKDLGMDGAKATFSQLREIWERDCEPALFDQLLAA